MRIISPILLIAFFTGVFCNSSKNIAISFKNDTNKYLDSGVVYMNNYKFTMHNIKPRGSIDAIVLRDSIVHNNHDITIRVYLFDKYKTHFNGGFYYNDLSGYFNDRYEINIDKNMNIIIK